MCIYSLSKTRGITLDLMKTYMHFRESKRELIPVELDKSAVLVHEMLKFQLATKIKQKYHVHSTNLNFKVLVNLIF